jgi:ABC-type phosphate/phosphonate transport system substrate-binding protein
MILFPRAFATTAGRWVRIALMMLFALASGCGRESQSGYTPQFADQPAAGLKEYLFAVHPLHNPERLFAVYGPIVEHLNVNFPGIRFRLEASRNYAEFEKKLYARRFHFALPNPYQTVKALDHGYRVFGKMGDDENFRGIILVRRDGGINSVADLKGKSVSYPAPTALAATMMPQYFLHTHGLDVNRDIKNIYVGSQESSIMNVYLGNVAAAARRASARPMPLAPPVITATLSLKCFMPFSVVIRAQGANSFPPLPECQLSGMNAPCARKPSISVLPKPQSASACAPPSPRRGAPRATAPGVRE